MHHPTDRITHTTAFVTPVVEHWLEREIGTEKDLVNQVFPTGVKEKASYTALLTWQQVHAKLPWGVIILLGGGFALADVSEVNISASDSFLFKNSSNK